MSAANRKQSGDGEAATKQTMEVEEEEHVDDEDEHVIINQFGELNVDKILEVYKDYDFYSRENTRSLIRECAGSFEHNYDSNALSCSEEGVKAIAALRALFNYHLIDSTGRSMVHKKNDPSRANHTLEIGDVVQGQMKLLEGKTTTIL